MSQRFLIRFSGKFFFHSCEKGVAMGVQVPSLGACMSYPAAFEVAQRLQKIGYYDAHVCTIAGLAATADDILLRQEDTGVEVSRFWEAQ